MKINLVLLTIFSTLFILVGGVFLFSNGTSSIPSPTEYEYYWSKDCDHCVNVQKFMDSWEGKDKVKVNKYEIYASNNSKFRFFDRGNLCKIPRDKLGIPLLLTPKGVCLYGDEPIIDHFKNLKI